MKTWRDRVRCFFIGHEWWPFQPINGPQLGWQCHACGKLRPLG